MSDPVATASAPWWSGLTRRHWMVLFVATLGWVFDVMDLYLGALLKDPAVAELTGLPVQHPAVALRAGVVLSATLVGWAVGGLVFGMVADRWGRSRTMALTILIYAAFTGFSGLAQTWWQLAAFRFVAALGIGGEWATGASMLAEVFPDRARVAAGGIMQGASVGGFFLATLVYQLTGTEGWRTAFFVGAVPALLAVVVRMGVEEPERWKAARAAGGGGGGGRTLVSRLGSLRGLFVDPRLARHAWRGAALATIGVFAYWGTMYWAWGALRAAAERGGASGAESARLATLGAQIMNAGILLGVLAFWPATQRLGRRGAFFLYYLGSALFVPAAFLLPRDWTQAVVLFCVAGGFTTGIFTGYTIYFPELFPTRLRATGAGFCYNVGRVVAAPGPLLAGWLVERLGVGGSGAVVGSVYALGLLVIPFLPETRDLKIEETDAGGES
jgi:MFS family permease